jgi:hypothetical protein
MALRRSSFVAKPMDIRLEKIKAPHKRPRTDQAVFGGHFH